MDIVISKFKKLKYLEIKIYMMVVVLMDLSNLKHLVLKYFFDLNNCYNNYHNNSRSCSCNCGNNYNYNCDNSCNNSYYDNYHYKYSNIYNDKYNGSSYDNYNYNCYKSDVDSKIIIISKLININNISIYYIQKYNNHVSIMSGIESSCIKSSGIESSCIKSSCIKSSCIESSYIKLLMIIYPRIPLYF